MNIKRIISSVLACASLLVFANVSYAQIDTSDDFYTFETVVTPEEINPGEQVTIEFYVKTKDGSDVSLSKSDTSGLQIGFDLPATVFSMTEDTDWFDESSTDYSFIDVNANGSIMVDNDGSNIKITMSEYGTSRKAMSWDNETPVFTIVAMTKDNATAGTYTVGTSAAQATMSDSYGNGQVAGRKIFISDTFTVKGSAPTGPSATTVGSATAGGIQEYAVSTGEKVMLSPKYTNQVITEATRFVVTYKGEKRIFGSDIYEKLGGTGGDLTIGSLTFGLIVTDSTAVATDFTFSIQ